VILALGSPAVTYPSRFPSTKKSGSVLSSRRLFSKITPHADSFIYKEILAGSCLVSRVEMGEGGEKQK
jgi:hypothetical protein